MDEKTIRLCERYRLVVFDARNWKLQEWREPSASREAKDRSARWFDTGNFFQQLGAALAFVFERRMREEGGPDMPEVIWTELDRRLMPEGMEWLLDVWPKWNNGEYCKFGDWWKSEKYGESKPQQLRKLSIYSPEQLREWGQDDGDHFGYEWDFVRPSDPKDRMDKVEPPAPKVLDADGAEIREGDTVYLLPGDWCDTFPCLRYHGGEKLVVIDLHPDHSSGGIKCSGETGVWCFPQPSQLTHRAPVLAADGKPLREGETVYEVGGTGHAYEVASIRIGDGNPLTPTVVTCDEGDGTSEHFLPSALTHERPDSWERLEEDIGAMVVAWRANKDLFDAQEAAAGCVGENTLGAALDSLARRVKALAERGR